MEDIGENSIFRCLDCNKNISCLTSDSYIGRCVTCWKIYDDSLERTKRNIE